MCFGLFLYTLFKYYLHESVRTIRGQHYVIYKKWNIETAKPKLPFSLWFIERENFHVVFLTNCVCCLFLWLLRRIDCVLGVFWVVSVQVKCKNLYWHFHFFSVLNVLVFDISFIIYSLLKHYFCLHFLYFLRL